MTEATRLERMWGKKITATPQDELPPLISDPREFEAWIECLSTDELKKAFNDHASAARAPLLETMKRWQSCGGCVGTFCKADALLARAEKAEARLAVAEALLKEAREWLAAEFGTVGMTKRIDAFLKEQK